MSRHPLYTAGYTGLTPGELLAAAVALGAVLADIRISPRSRNPAWNQRRLIEAWGPRYVHVPELGNLNYKGGYGAGIVLADFEAGAPQIAALLERGPVILLCACVDHRSCHRTPVAEGIAEHWGVEVVHLSAADVYRLASGQHGL